MKDPELLIFIVFLIAAFGSLFVWLYLKPKNDERIIVMLISGTIVLFLSYGLYIQNPETAIFHL